MESCVMERNLVDDQTDAMENRSLHNNIFFVAIHPDNDLMDWFILDGKSYTIYKIRSGYKKDIRLIGQITVIRPLDREGSEEGLNVKRGHQT